MGLFGFSSAKEIRTVESIAHDVVKGKYAAVKELPEEEFVMLLEWAKDIYLQFVESFKEAPDKYRSKDDLSHPYFKVRLALALAYISMKLQQADEKTLEVVYYNYLRLGYYLDITPEEAEVAFIKADLENRTPDQQRKMVEALANNSGVTMYKQMASQEIAVLENYLSDFISSK